VGVRTEALRKLLEELHAAGIPVESEKDHPHVYWSVSRNWYPGGILFQQEHVPDLVRQLRRLPQSKAREKLLGIVAEQVPARVRHAPQPTVVSRRTSEHDEQFTPIVEDAAARKVALFMRYATTSHGRITDRHASVHLVDVGPPARFIATCHRNGDLRWFRVDGIVTARPDEREPFRDHPATFIAAFRDASLDGYKGDAVSTSCSFFVRAPESNWVANNLLEGMRVESRHDGIRVSIETSAVARLARFVVALGEAARPENESLAKAVRDLARGALAQAESVLTETDGDAISEELTAATAQLLSGV
jgi:predicted DNA-binding transcriptional regulator YafY